MKNYLRFLIGGVLFPIILLTNALALDDGTRVNFRRGTSSATIKGTVAKGGPDFYLVGAKAGQTMTVKVTGKVSFGIDASGERLTEDDGNTNWSEELPSDGDYKVKVFSSGGAQNHTLTVSIAAAQKTSQKFTTSGYYDGIGLSSKESGDYYGMSIYLTESDGQLYGLVTTAVGDYSTPLLVEVNVSGKDMRTVEFTLPDENGDRKFKGTVMASGLTVKSDRENFAMKRECGFLSSNISLGSGGDYGGMEVFLTDTGGQWYALVTSAEGVLKRPVLVEAKVTLGKDYAADLVEFTLPGANGGRKFKGKLTKTGLMLNEGETRLVLKEKCYR
jgi:hypothetical protein